MYLELMPRKKFTRNIVKILITGFFENFIKYLVSLENASYYALYVFCRIWYWMQNSTLSCSY